MAAAAEEATSSGQHKPTSLAMVMDAAAVDMNTVTVTLRALCGHDPFQTAREQPDMREDGTDDPNAADIPEEMRFCCSPKCGKPELSELLRFCKGCRGPMYCNEQCLRDG